MANIQSALLLEDRMSQPLMNINRSLSDMSVSVERVQAVAATMFNTASLTVTREQFNAINISVEQMWVGLDKVGKAVGELEERARNANNELAGSSDTLGSISSHIENVSASLKEQFSFDKIMELSDEMLQTSAHINLINDGMQTNKRLQDMIFQSAQNTGTAYQSAVDRVTDLANNAGDMFSSTAEVVSFAELVSKQFAIAGMSSEEASDAFLLLTETLSSGVIEGEAFNNTFADAPNMIQTIADYLNVPIGKLEEMAAGGELTADIVKNAIFSATDEINNKFNSMPMIWDQIGNTLNNLTLMALQPILEKFSEIANNPSFQEFAAGIIDTMASVADAIGWIMDMAIRVASVICDNWSIIEPIIYGIATAILVYRGYLAACTAATEIMKAAQFLLNLVMGMNPVMLIVLGMIALISIVYSVVAAINQFAGTSTSATGIVVGCLYTAVAFVWNLFLGILDLVLGIINFLVNKFVLFANFFANIFKNPISSVIYLFQGMADGVLGVLQKIASAMDFVFGSNMADTVAGWRSGLKTMADDVVAKYAPNEDYQTVMDNIDLSVDSLGFERMDYTNSFNAGYDAGQNIGNKTESLSNNSKGSDVGGITNSVNPTNTVPTVTDLAGTQAGTDIGSTAGNTAEVAKSVSDSTEEIKYLRDVAEREVINRFTTAEIKVDMGGIYNKVSKDTDIDGIVSHLENTLYESLSSTAEQYNG